MFSPQDQKYLPVLLVPWAHLAGTAGRPSSCSDWGSWLSLTPAPRGLGRAACGLRIPLGVYAPEALLPVQGGG